MEFLITALFILTVSGIGLKFLGNRDNVFISVFKIVPPLAGCALAFIPLFDSLVNLHTISAVLPWKVFGGPVRLELDPLSAVFLLPVLILSACAAVYGRRYLQAHKNAYDRGTVWCSFNLLVALDTGSSFEGMGASREALFSALTEPVVFFILSSLVFISKHYSLSSVLLNIDPFTANL